MLTDWNEVEAALNRMKVGGTAPNDLETCRVAILADAKQYTDLNNRVATEPSATPE